MRNQSLDLSGVGEVRLSQDGAASNGFNFRLSMKCLIQRLMIVKDNVKAMPGESQGEGFPQPMGRAGDEGKRTHGTIINAGGDISGKEGNTDRNADLSMCFLPFLCACFLLAEIIGNKEPDIGWTFCKTPHEVGIPMPAKGNIDADRIAFIYKLLL
jgi:hypothetical protein